MTEYLDGVCKRNCSGLNVPCTKECAIPKEVNKISKLCDEAIHCGCSDRIEELEDELHTMKTAGIIEVAIRNPNVFEYVAHWERRAEGAEAKLAKAAEERDEALNQLDSARYSVEVLEKRVAKLTGGKDE